MDDDRSRAAEQPEYESQARRAQRGVVAGYIHEVSKRHGTPGAAASPPYMPLPRRSRGHSEPATAAKPGRPDSPLGSPSR